MSYYSDLFMRPKQAVLYALQNPSMVRSVAFILLGTLAGVLTSLLFAGTIFLDSLLTFFIGDVLRWLVSGIILLLFGFVFKRLPVNMLNISRVLSTLAQLNVYGFLMFLCVGLLLPAIAIPELISASNDLNNGLIGEEEFSLIIQESFFTATNGILLALPLVLLGFLFVLYGIYVLFLSIQKYLDVSVFKSLLVFLVIVFVQSIIVLSWGGG